MITKSVLVDYFRMHLILVIVFLRLKCIAIKGFSLESVLCEQMSLGCCDFLFFSRLALILENKSGFCS